MGILTDNFSTKNRMNKLKDSGFEANSQHNRCEPLHLHLPLELLKIHLKYSDQDFRLAGLTSRIEMDHHQVRYCHSVSAGVVSVKAENGL